MKQPILEAPRLTLRPFRIEDAPDVQRLAGDRAIADTTLNVPHPYEDGVAEAWIESLNLGHKAGKLATFAMERRDDGDLVGAIGLKFEPQADKADLGYWVGKPYWNQGYATEAAVAMLGYGFGERQLNRITARYLVRNPSSGRVMQKAGLQLEGTLRQETKKWGVYEDLRIYGILQDEWRVAGETR